MIKFLIRLIPVPSWRDRLMKSVGHGIPLVAVVRLSGIIGPSSPLRGGINLAAVADDLEQAFSIRHAEAVAIIVNSPGGSPVQSSLIGKRIRGLAEEHEKPVFAFAEDVAASGGYWLACAADEIYADDSSIIGSVGVIMAGFGFPEALKKLGIERRVHTAGDSKAMLDPFQPEDPEDVTRIETIQAEVHETFKAHVRKSRDGKLNAPEEELFNGAFWSGRKAQELGLVDGIGDLRAVMRDKYGEDVHLKLIGGQRPWWRRRTGAEIATSSPGTTSVSLLPAGENWVEGLLAGLQARSLWSRFGL